MSLYVEVGTERCTKCELNDVLFQPIISVLIVATFFSFITYSLFLCYLLLAGGEGPYSLCRHPPLLLSFFLLL